MQAWTQKDRFESTVSTHYNGLVLRVVAAVTCSDTHATAKVFARLNDGGEIEIAVPVSAESLDEALLGGKLAAIAYADSAASASAGAMVDQAQACSPTETAQPPLA